MVNVREILSVERKRLQSEIDRVEVALGALGAHDGKAGIYEDVRPALKVASPKARAPRAPLEARAARAGGGKRGPDSELTKARKRISSAKRFGKEPSQADLDLVATNEGATAPDGASEAAE